MAGRDMYESTTTSPDSSLGNYRNGPRGYSGISLDRSSSFRKGADSRMSAFGEAVPRRSSTSSDIPTLSQSLMLDPIMIGGKRNAHSVSVSSGSGDSSFENAYLKNSPPVSVKELKRLRASVADTHVKASGRAKRLDDHLNKLDKYVETMPNKKRWLDLMANERSTGLTLKIGSQIQRNFAQHGNQKLDDEPKNVVLHKHVRSTVTEIQVSSWNDGIPRPSLVAKERELVKYNDADSDVAKEKIRSLPSDGEGWDKKVKRKHSVGAGFSKSVDIHGEVKRTMHHKSTTKSGLQAMDSDNVFRPGASSGSKKLDSTAPVGSCSRAAFNNEQEKSARVKDFSAGLNAERAFREANVKLNNHEDSRSDCHDPVLKRKFSRAPRRVSAIATNTGSNIPHVPGSLESWEQSQGVNKANKSPSDSGANNRKPAMPAGTSSPHIIQWGSQRPHKISRSRRTNLMPVSNQDEVLMQVEAFSPSSFGPRLSTSGTNSSFLSKSGANRNQSSKFKPENVPSPARLSESKEPGAGENRMKDSGMGCGDVEKKSVIANQNVKQSAIHSEMNKNVVKKEIEDGVRRQERSERVPPFSRRSISPSREKGNNMMSTKPLRNASSGSDKTRSKSGRQLKKLADRRGFPRLGDLSNGCSPDCSGESEDDHEELLEAANLVYNSSSTACLSDFWKIVEPLFASIGPDEKAYLSLQDDYDYEDNFASDAFSCGRNRHLNNETGLKDSLDGTEFLQHLQNSSLLQHPDALKEHEMSTPYYQRVLSALIVDVDIEEFEETGFGRPRSSVNDDTFLLSCSETKQIDRLKFHNPILARTQKNGNQDFVLPCNGSTVFDKIPSARGHLCNAELLQEDSEFILSEVESSVRLCDCVAQSVPANNCNVYPCDCPYEQMSVDERIVFELQSIGLLESIPDLDDKEDESINPEIFRLEGGLHKQNEKKKTSLDKIYTSVQEFRNDGRYDPDQYAMDKLVELAYKKLLASKSSFASKHGISKVPKQVALAFIKRTLARCRKFEDSGPSCFAEPAVREIIHAASTRVNETESLAYSNLRTSNDDISSGTFAASTHQSGHSFAKNGPKSNRGKKKEVLLDDVVGPAAFRASPAPGLSNGAKRTRSERNTHRDTSTRKAAAKSERFSMPGSKADKKTKSKPKQKTSQLCLSGNESVNKFTDTKNPVFTTAGGHRKRDVTLKSSENSPPMSSKETKGSVDATNLKVGNMEALGLDGDDGLPQDINSWLGFEVEGGIQEYDSVGLLVPTDELTDIF